MMSKTATVKHNSDEYKNEIETHNAYVIVVEYMVVKRNTQY